MAELKDTGERAFEPCDSQCSINYLRHHIAYRFAQQFVKDKVVLDDGCGNGEGYRCGSA